MNTNKIFPTDALWYLLEIGVIEDLRSIVLKQYSVIKTGSKNIAIIVLPQDKSSSGYLIKQSKENGAPADIANEILYYERFGALPELANYLVTSLYADTDHNILTLEYLTQSQTLYAYISQLLYKGNHTKILELASKLGCNLSSCHNGMNIQVRFSNDASTLRTVRPTVFEYLRRKLVYSEHQSRGQAEVLQLIHKYPTFQETLQSVSDSWKINSVIHSDMKFENMLIHKGSESLKIIDWELMGLGDCAWDIAGILQSFFRIWVLATENEAALQTHFPNILMGMQAFWKGYRNTTSSLPDGIARHLLEKSLWYAGIRLIQSCYEAEAKSNKLRPTTWMTMQLSMNLLTETDEILSLIEENNPN